MAYQPNTFARTQRSQADIVQTSKPLSMAVWVSAASWAEAAAAVALLAAAVAEFAAAVTWVWMSFSVVADEPLF